MAIKDINADTSIFPNNTINMVSVNNWDPQLNYTMNDDSGAFASIQTLNTIKNGIIGAFGDFLSSTTSYTAQIMSDFNVPFCGATQTDPAFDEKKNYGYFIRMQYGHSMGQAILSLIQKWDIQRYALVVGSDEDSLLTTVDVTKVLSPFSNKYQQVVKVILTPSMQIRSDYIYPISTLKSLKVKYIFLIASSELSADFYYAAR
jgi:ABC-type branched-subunit amino acid transport system substrate-binding protein